MKYRKGKPFARYATNHPQAGTVELTADADGVVKIHTEAEAIAADAFRLPVTRKPKTPSAEKEV